MFNILIIALVIGLLVLLMAARRRKRAGGSTREPSPTRPRRREWGRRRGGGKLPSHPVPPTIVDEMAATAAPPAPQRPAPQALRPAPPPLAGDDPGSAWGLGDVVAEPGWPMPGDASSFWPDGADTSRPAHVSDSTAAPEPAPAADPPPPRPLDAAPPPPADESWLNLPGTWGDPEPPEATPGPTEPAPLAHETGWGVEAAAQEMPTFMPVADPEPLTDPEPVAVEAPRPVPPPDGAPDPPPSEPAPPPVAEVPPPDALQWIAPAELAEAPEAVAVEASPAETGLSFVVESEPVVAPPVPELEPSIADVGAQADEIARLFPVVSLGPRPLNAILDQDGVTPRMLALMRHLADGPATISEQAQALGASRSMVADIVARLEIWALARRARDVQNRRRVLVHLTEEGRALLFGASDTVDGRALEGLLSQLDPGAREGLLAGLRALAAVAAPRPR